MIYCMCLTTYPLTAYIALMGQGTKRSLKERLDQLLVKRQLFKSRSAAQRAIMAGEVRVGGKLIDKAGTQVQDDAEIMITKKRSYVSQGGLKLETALKAFAVDPTNKTCLDVGASTGGFTDCLLQHGARKVYAVDVGTGQLAWKLRTDKRVVNIEDFNARYLKPVDIGEPIDLATVDVSFISLRLILPPLAAIVRPEAEIIALVKPQFEAGKAQVGRGGVVRDPKIHLAVLESIAQFTQEKLKLFARAAVSSPVKGPAGNIEFFLYLANTPDQAEVIDFEHIVSEAHGRS
jgi:23S rRNA (cytidine1920-2'-O)/16S rRNA (cytidine1409-2'-O)-methyltransferase